MCARYEPKEREIERTWTGREPEGRGGNYVLNTCVITTSYTWTKCGSCRCCRSGCSPCGVLQPAVVTA